MRASTNPIIHPVNLVNDLEVAVIIPCYNEATTIGGVVEKFKAFLPHGRIYVYDNNSSDLTCRMAQDSGASVRREELQGKGYVVNRMFADIEADIYVMVDGDDTYDITNVDSMIKKLVQDNYDMVVGVRKHTQSSCYRTGHIFGNYFFNSVVSIIFGRRVNDMLSGFRVFSRRFVKTFPYLVCGFEIETALTIHALELRAPFGEYEVAYNPRVEGSQSKLNTYKDGIRILGTVVNLFRDEKPLTFFGLLAIQISILAVLLGTPHLSHYVTTGTIQNFTAAIGSVVMLLLSMFLVISGVILQSVKRGRQELKRLFYLAQN